METLTRNAGNSVDANLTKIRHQAEALTEQRLAVEQIAQDTERVLPMIERGASDVARRAERLRDATPQFNV